MPPSCVHRQRLPQSFPCFRCAYFCLHIYREISRQSWPWMAPPPTSIGVSLQPHWFVSKCCGNSVRAVKSHPGVAADPCRHTISFFVLGRSLGSTKLSVFFSSRADCGLYVVMNFIHRDGLDGWSRGGGVENEWYTTGSSVNEHTHRSWIKREKKKKDEKIN